MKTSIWLTGALFCLCFIISSPIFSAQKLLLKENWQVQSSELVSAGGAEISLLSFKPKDWYQTKIPATVLAVLVENRVYPDPYYGENLKQIPGFVKGRMLVMPKDSPFYPPWWYRTCFMLPEKFKGKYLFLHFDGINYRANIWLNGKKIADDKQVIGMFRRFEFPINDYVYFDRENCLAVEIIAPGKLPQKIYLTKQVEATTGWDDHNPYPPDINMGIWQDVYISASGAVRIKHPFVLSDLEVPSLKQAKLTISCLLENVSDEMVKGELTGKIENISFSQKIQLAPKEKRWVKFTPKDYPQLIIKNPRVWWPHPVGPQNLYWLELKFLIQNQLSDEQKVRFGIRKITSYLNEEGWRQFEVNGRKILIRGGAWMTTDMLLRLSKKRYTALVRYAREANFNMLRSEGFSIRETEDFYNLCDELGVMVTQQIFGRSIPDEELAIKCTEDTILRIRNHPSLVHFLGHDETNPTPTLDRAYRELIAKYAPDRTYQPNSGAFRVKDRWKTGGTRTGTLELWRYATPPHYYMHKKDGAWGFAQSGGIGGVVASLESIKRTLPEDKLWPPWNSAWSFHTNLQGTHYYDRFFKEMKIRYGKPTDIEDFVKKAHLMNYASARGMFEAYARNKYYATGITTWKYDTAWPAVMTWQYVDWYLIPTSAYYGAKKACEPLHIQYSYDDDSIYVVNSFYQDFRGLKAEAEIYDFNLQKRWSKSKVVDVDADGKTKVFIVEFPSNLTRTFFLRLKLWDRNGKLITENFYWLSTKRDRPGKMLYGIVPITPYHRPDYTLLKELPEVELKIEGTIGEEKGEKVAVVRVKNPSEALAFFIRLALIKGKDGLEVAPSYWDENCFSLLPGEEKIVRVRFSEKDLEGKAPFIRTCGWNIIEKEYQLY